MRTMWKVDRSLRSRRSCHLRKTKRVSHPPQRGLTPPAPRTIDEGVVPIVERKRKDLPPLLDAFDSMNRAKRRRFEYRPPSAWEELAWHKEHIKDLTPSTDITHAIQPRWRQPSPGQSPPVRRSAPNKLLRYSPYGRPTRQKLWHINLSRDPTQALEFLWSDDERDNSPLFEERADLSMADETKLDPTPVTRVVTKDPTPPPSDSEIASQDGLDFDEDDAREFRRYLRRMPESLNDDGYRVAIDGTISPASKTWNLEHRLKLTKEAVARKETPSKVPQPPVSTPPASAPSTPQKHEPSVPKTSLRVSFLSKLTWPNWFSSKTAQQVSEEESETPATSRRHVKKESETSALSRIHVKEESETSVPPRMQVKEESETPSPSQVPAKEESETPAPSQMPAKEESETPAPSQMHVKGESENFQDGEIDEALPAREHIARDAKGKVTPDVQDESATPSSGVGSTEIITNPTTPITQPETPPKAEITKRHDPYETPAQQLSKLSISKTRTPKASVYQSARTERKTRRQQRLEQIAAAKDKYKLVPLGAVWNEKVHHAVRNGIKDAGGYTKYEDTDLSRVVPEYSSIPGWQDPWLNDVIINDYLGLVVKHGNRDDRPCQVPSHATLASHAWTKIEQDPKSLPTRWAKRQGIQGKNLLECEVIFLPINSGMHWTLCVIEPKHHKRITVYNSMGSRRGHHVAHQVLQWCKHEVGITFSEAEWTINPVGQSPQQRNADDCGVFTITTARQIMLGQMEKAPYGAEIMPVQRRRIVAELLEGRLLSAEESAE